MTDIIDELRTIEKTQWAGCLEGSAADEIERLRADFSQLKVRHGRVMVAANHLLTALKKISLPDPLAMVKAQRKIVNDALAEYERETDTR